MLENIVPLEAVHFFAFQIDCYYAKGKKLESHLRHRLPSLSSFYENPSFADVAMGWHEKGILLSIAISGAFNKSDFPKFSEADSIELFFDTRDVKSAGYNTRFCHHFYFLPEPVENNEDQIQAGEVTRFRTDDMHELCNPQLLEVKFIREKKGDTLLISFPQNACMGMIRPSLTGLVLPIV